MFYCLFYDTNNETPFGFCSPVFLDCRLHSMQIQPLTVSAKSHFFSSRLTIGSNVPLCDIQCTAISSLPLLSYVLYLQLRVNTDKKGSTRPGYFSVPVLQILPKKQRRAPFMLLWLVLPGEVGCGWEHKYRQTSQPSWPWRTVLNVNLHNEWKRGKLDVS